MFYSDAMTPVSIPAERRKGRAATSNPDVRFDRYSAEGVDDGWDIEEGLPQIRTEVSIERPRKVITRNTSPDVGFDRSINPYRGCEHGCIYCFARPTHAYLGMSAGLDFETKLVARPEAPEQLVRELRAQSYVPRMIAMGTNTDPYQPIEREHGITRRILQVLLEHRHPVGMVTKGTLIERDVDVLGELASLGLTRVGISMTTLDADLSRRMEPRVPAPKRRLKAIERLSKAGIDVRVMVSPLVPGLTDPEMEAILTAARDAGAVAASWINLRLPYEVSPLFRDWLAEHYPDRAARVMGRVREAHGGKDYDAQWGKRMRGEGEYAQMMAQRFKLAVKRLGLDRDLPPLRTDLFRIPPRAGDQLELF
ncbi:PA0069 family radical SAM protein [Pseudoruegeria sp. HB172150]|uniref:PA0069 family radical SAM protein n=1 Tax=Pseudoruegeria sp. HB172150 TaxID=2721164 RepID=UPI001551A714|nr:PA0069 family radical SAM protein [Pseudoruegeria sp. HB172150]